MIGYRSLVYLPLLMAVMVYLDLVGKYGNDRMVSWRAPGRDWKHFWHGDEGTILR